MASERIEQLLDLWMTDRDRGIARTAAEVCAGNPELVEELSRRIQIVKRFEQLADIGHSETLVSQGDVDTSHLTTAPVPTSLKQAAMPGDIGSFRPLELLGEGGMGAVYLAEDSQLGRRVAVKVMKKELAADPDAKHRFLREARAMATVEHDNIMTIYAVGEDQGMPYLVMPVLKGETLDDRLRRESRLSAAETRRIGQEIAAGLAAAHSHGLIHRDIKPSNIWLEGTQGRVRILNFGLARPATEDQKVTQSGAVLGTPAYMSPEQAAGMEATPRSDLFSLGAVLYRMVTGQQPFAGPNMMATLNNLANKQPEPPHKICSEVPESLSDLILRLIAKPAGLRPDSAAAVVESLQQTAETIVPQLPISPSPVPVVKKNAVRPTVAESAKAATSSTRPPRTLRNAMAGGFAGLLILLSFVVYRIQTDKGVLIVSIDDEQVAAKLTKGGLEIEDAKTGRTWTIKPDQPESVSAGEYKISPPDGLLLHVTDDTGTEFTTAEFKIKRGDQITVRVTLEKREGSVVVNPEWKGWPKDAPAPAIAPFDAEQAKHHQEEWAKHLGVPVEYTNSIGMKFVLVPPGEFLMGSTTEEIDKAVALTKVNDPNNALDGEKCIRSGAPEHQVILTQPFYLGAYEVTQTQYERVMGSNPSQFSSTGRARRVVEEMDTSEFPVEAISWNLAAEFCETLNQSANSATSNVEQGPRTLSTGSGYRLPTEAEWEFACLAGGTKVESKDQDSDRMPSGWYEPHSKSRPHPVGELKPNAFGLFDMRGNVWEWVADWLDYACYNQFGNSPAIDPIATAEGNGKRVFRGGSWSDAEPFCLASMRGGFDPNARFGSFGLRVALSVDSAKQALAKAASESNQKDSDWKGWPKDAPAPAIAPFDAVQAKCHQEEWAKHLGVPVEYTNSIGMKFVLIPPGEFLMGSTSEEVSKEDAFVNKSDARWMECLQTESPKHRVLLSEAIYVAAHEVTTQQFLTLSSETNSKSNSGKDDHPVVWVTHKAAEVYCRLLNDHESVPGNPPGGASVLVVPAGGNGYRLLTEAEWEFACRAGTSTRFWSGADEASMGEAAWFADNSAGSTHPVGTRMPNAFGLHDMLGNAWEWCADEWSPTYYAELSKKTAVSPAGPQLNKSVYVARGGDWHDVTAACRSAFRYGYPVSFRSSGMGFRIAVPWQNVHELTTRNTKDQQGGSSATGMKNQTAEASPLAVLDGKQIPPEERTPELPPETVAVLGSSHGKTWGSPIYTTHGNMTYSPDGKWLVECDSSNIYLFDASTLRLKKRFPLAVHFWTDRSASFGSDSQTLFLAAQGNAGGSGNSVTNLMSPELNTTHDSVGFGYSYVIANSRDDNWVAMNSANENEVRVGHRDTTTHSLNDMRPIPDAPALPNTSAIGRVLDLAFSPDGQWLISGHSTGTSGGYRVSRKQGEDFVSVAFIPVQINQYCVRIAYSFTEGRKVALLTAGDVCHQVDLSLPSDLPVQEAGLPVIRADALIGIHDVTVSADGQTWAASKNNFGIQPVALIGTWQDGLPVVRHTIPVPGHSVGHVAMSPDVKSLAVTNDNRSIVLYDLTGETPVAGINSELYSTAVSTDSDVYVTISTAGKVQLSRLGNDGDRVLDRCDSPDTRMGFHNACISSDGKRAIAFSAPDGSRENQSRLQCWEILNNQLVEGPSLDVAVENAYSKVLMFHSGTRMMYGNQIRDVSTNPATIVTTFSKMSSRQPACAVSDDDQLVALVGDGNMLAVFDPDQSAEDPIASIQLPGPPTSMDFSPDGRRIVTTHNGPVCIVWELNGNQISEVARMPSFSYEGFSGMYHTTTSVFSGDGESVFIGAWGDVVEWKLDDNSLGRHWSIPGFTWLSRTDDGQHLIFNNSNTTTWILRLTKP